MEITFLKLRLNKSKNFIVFFFVLLVVIPAIMVGITFFYFSFNTIQKNEIAQTLELVERTNTNTEGQLLQITNLINSMVANENIYKIFKNTPFDKYDSTLYVDYSYINKYISSLSAQYPYLKSVILVQPKNGSLIFGNSKGLSKSEFVKSGWYNDTLALHGQMNWIGSGASKGLESNESGVFWAARQIIDENNFEFTGVICLSYGGTLPGISQNTGINEPIYMIDSKSNVIYASTGKISDLQDYEALKSIAEHKGGGYFKSTLKNRSSLVVYSSLNNFGLRLVRIVPEENIYSKLSQILYLYMAILAICLTLFLIFLYTISKRFFVPLNKLSMLVNSLNTNQSMDFDVSLFPNYELRMIGNELMNLADKNRNASAKILYLENVQDMILLDKLQAQVNPHFLYNILTSIKFIALINGQQEINQLITSLINLLKNSINKEGIFITVKNELQNLQYYIDLENAIYQNKIKFIFELDAALNEKIISNFILQPLVENAIIHGIDPNSGNGRIAIRNYCNNGNIFFEIEDNGVGMDEKEIEIILNSDNSNKNTFSTLGLRGVNKKVKLIYGEEYGINIKSIKNAGTKVVLMLPDDPQYSTQE